MIIGGGGMHIYTQPPSLQDSNTSRRSGGRDIYTYTHSHPAYKTRIQVAGQKSHDIYFCMHEHNNYAL